MITEEQKKAALKAFDSLKKMNDQEGEIDTGTFALKSAMLLDFHSETIRALLAPEPSAVDAAYKERNQVVAALAKSYPSGVGKTAIDGWDEAWHNCVYIDLPTGQASWHYHDRDAYLFEGLPLYAGKWDGHTTPEKYDRLHALSPAPDSVTDDVIEAINYLRRYDKENITLDRHIQTLIRAATTPKKEVVELVRDAVSPMMDACGNSYSNAWLEKWLIGAKEIGAYQGKTVGRIEKLKQDFEEHLAIEVKL